MEIYKSGQPLWKAVWQKRAECINKLWYIHTAGYYLVVRMNDQQLYNKIDESQRHYVKQKCPDIEGYMLHDSIYIKYQKKKKKVLLEVR